jgi:uncharacterized membrane protein YraQ (UPF0718 family)
MAKLGESVHFFIYDSIKILFLLFFMIFAIGIIRTFLPTSKVKQWMGKRGFSGNLFASLFGAVTPFCSCSSIPIFISFVSAGIPLGIAFSFLITSPIINEYLVVLMIGFFGWKITVAYVLSGLFIGTFVGVILGKMGLEDELVTDIFSSKNVDNKEVIYKRFIDRVSFGLREAIDIVKKVWLWVLVGVAIGAGIHNYIPEETIQSIIGKTGIFSVPIATLLGVPMYGGCAAIVPIAVVLFQKGIPLGTALSFMMAVSALSLPEAVLLRRAMKIKLIIIFFSVTTLTIIITGYLFNILQKVLV